MGFLSWLIIGSLAGWIASKIMGTDAQMGKFANILGGVVGGIGANIVLGYFGLVGLTGFSIQSLIVCIVGAAVVIWLVKQIKK